jgi:NADPH-dependent curcumin reductase CurA
MSTLKRWVLRRRPVGAIQPGDLEFIEEPIRDMADGEVQVRTLYLSLDPTNRIWMSDQDQYMPPVNIGDTMRGGSLGVVERSRSDRFKQGDVVNTGLGGWSTHVVAPGGALSPAPQLPGVPLTAYMSVLGATGLTAWFGMCDIGKPLHL